MRRDQALISHERTVLGAFGEVEDQLAALTLLLDQASELDAQRVATENALRIAHDRYQAGYASYLDELDIGAPGARSVETFRQATTPA